MDHVELKNIIKDLVSSAIEFKSIEDKSVTILKAIGWQLALNYKHSADKESVEVKKYLSLLIQVRQLVKSKLNKSDLLMNKFLNDTRET